ncbi:MAG TPA: PAS domain S-box protein, partial [Opitutaceae bacterium]|nr:PAS domain S-box protein [Opitutaceae bacterium]
MKLLHLEDNGNDAELVENVLRETWPACKIKHAVTRKDFLAALDQGGFDLIMSDYTLPDMDGLSALDLAREKCPDKPFIFFSGTIGEERAVEALRRGAVDYVIKDRPARLVPAIRQAIDKIEKRNQLGQAQERIREQASLLDKAHDAIWVTDFRQRITYWNTSAELLSGWTAEEAIGRDVRTLLFKQDNQGYLDALKKLKADGEWRGELRLQGKTDSTAMVESRWTVVADDEGVPKAILSINTDVTEKKKLETQLLRTQRMESIGALASGIAHDLNNSLTPILMAMGLLREKAHNLESRAI